ncbi:hypothetical protein GT028_17215 [Streptomyces sp. SID2999]|uniref:hypothetical protein n=1 Tax=Streptomyces sp. SID2999 TaxID=2690258 RepID=UPI00136BCEFD|nr:hypothetical protein [Streptomyces sp. SID2999]MYZ09095.1 hypothetical protein [Streptomyces sp. SID2999]
MNIKKEKFRDIKVAGTGREISGYELAGCEFNGCVLAQFDDPRMGLAVRDLTAKRTAVKRCTVHGVRFDSVLIDGLTTSSLLHLSGCVFKNVTLRGRIGPLMTAPPSATLPEGAQSAFVQGIVDFYADVDWALDISGVELSDADFYYVPGDLVRRDPETQFLLRRDVVGDGVDIGDVSPCVEIAVSRFEVSPFDSMVAVAPRRAKYFKEALAGFQELRERGLAE